MPTVTIEYFPRTWQREVHEALDNPKVRRAVIVCHRRFGKTVLGINHLVKGALTCKLPRPRFASIGPTYTQSKSTSWDYLQHYSRPIPNIAVNQSELRVDYPNAGQVRLYGADNPDSLRGLYFDGAVMDEYGMHPWKSFSEVVGPSLSDRIGWALFMGTPNGKNQFWEIVQQAKEEVAAGNPAWWFGNYPVSKTGLISPEVLKATRLTMTDDEYEQEYECSFEASVRGAIFAKELAQAETSQRITRVPYEPILPVDTDWDLGVGDASAIWFTQRTRSGEVRVIDYYEASGEGLPHYAALLKSKPYTYGEHWAPHDIEVRELGTGKSRLEIARSLGLNFRVTRKLPLEDGIHAARLLLPRCWFDQERCKVGLEALRHYRRDWNSRLNIFKDTPIHDQFSHAADAFRGLAVREQEIRVKKSRPVARVSSSWMGG